jgi:O-succinylhomoserine sulfhydrylase
MDEENKGWGYSTLGVRSAEPRSEAMEHSASISLTSSYVFKTAAEAAAVFAGEKPGNIYSRFTNPTVQAFEQRLARMEGGDACVATASGMAAILTLCMSLLKAGDHVLASRGLFGASINLFNNVLARFGLSTSFVDMTDLAAWERGFQPNTRLVFVETPSNPLMELCDIRALADLSHRRGALLCVDNCFLTPVLQQPLQLGADLVIHSATKFLDGQGRCVGGAGPCMSPFNAWVFLKGLETLALRVRAQSAAALALAEWLARQPKVKRVFYPGLENHPQYALAKSQQSGFGAVVTFEVEGGREGAWKLIDATRLLSITANLGDTRTTITHPATTTHGRITPEARAAAGITEGLVRIAVGLEDLADIQRDLEAGLR